MPGEPLAADRRGAGPAICLLHGFTQTARCWGDLVERLATSQAVVALDAPGHGASGDAAPDLWDTADRIAATAGRATYVGYSMGARMALHVALARPELVEGLVLISGTAGIDSAAERAERRAADERLADHIEAIGVPSFLDEWLALPLFVGLSASDADRPERERNTAAGLASSLRHAGTGTQQPLWDRLVTIDVPVLVVAGARDPKFAALAARLAGAIGRSATLEIVEGAGHTVHRERPDAFAEVLGPWLRRR